MNIVNIVVGLLVLTLGRKLFWLFVGVAGFVLGIIIATRFFEGQPGWLILVIALGAGLVGALLAVFIQQVAIAIAGFIGGGYVALSLLEAFGVQTAGTAIWIPFIIGGIIGLILVIALFDWALIVLSSLVGASLIVQAVDLRPGVEWVLFAALVVVGLVIQAAILQREELGPPPAVAE
jgi:hypothetical protein